MFPPGMCQEWSPLPHIWRKILLTTNAKLIGLSWIDEYMSALSVKQSRIATGPVLTRTTDKSEFVLESRQQRSQPTGLQEPLPWGDSTRVPDRIEGWRGCWKGGERTGRVSCERTNRGTNGRGWERTLMNELTKGKKGMGIPHWSIKMCGWKLDDGLGSTGTCWVAEWDVSAFVSNSVRICATHESGANTIHNKVSTNASRGLTVGRDDSRW